jgi:alpha,alpha-trehalose phosphorylase
VIEHPAYSCEAWRLTETGLHLDVLAQSESVFALSNGHLGMRGNLDEGEPHGLPGTYLASFYELRPLPIAESAYGQSEASQTVVNVTNGKIIRLLVDDEPFDVRYGRVVSHRRCLDFRAGTLRREVTWESPGERVVNVRSTRLVSLTQRAVAAIAYDLEAVSHDVRVVIQSELVANEVLPGAPDRDVMPGISSGGTADPRAAANLADPLISLRHISHGSQAMLIHRTRESGLTVAAMMDHEVLQVPEDREVLTETFPDVGRVTVIAYLRRGQRVRFVKYLSYGWSASRSVPALEDQVAGANYAARHTGFGGLVADQRSFLDRFWARSDVEVDGDDEVQQAVRFALFHVLQAGARGETRAIAAKGLTGTGYDGHAFWDTETFVLPLLTYTAPTAAGDALRWRHGTLPLAVERARQLGLQGADFPWRTIHGEECSGYWPASTAAFHINADIADAVIRHLNATGDVNFARDCGLEILVETARLWTSLGHFDDGRGFRIDGVTGPDEYSAVADNNVYTNLMAQQNLRAAVEMSRSFPRRAAELGVAEAELEAWQRAADAMVVPYDEEAGVHPQSDGFTRHQKWDFEGTGDDQYPLMLHFPYFDLYRKQVVKQADLVLALYLRGDAFSLEEKARNFDYYETVTVRDSSLSASVQSVVAAEVGYLDLAYDYLSEAAMMDLGDLEHNTRDGLHMASLAGAWLALVAGLGGMRDQGGKLCFSPRLPVTVGRLRFRILYHGLRLTVDVTGEDAAYSVTRDAVLASDLKGLTFCHHGEELSVPIDATEKRAIPALDRRPAPHQPRGRAPQRRQGAGRRFPVVDASDEVDEWGLESFPASDPPAV